MLSQRRCAHTGVVNFFSADEPHFSVGSVIKAERTAGYLWRCYAEPFTFVGTAADMLAAEERIADLCAQAARHHGKAQYDCAA